MNFNLLSAVVDGNFLESDRSYVEQNLLTIANTLENILAPTLSETLTPIQPLTIHNNDDCSSPSEKESVESETTDLANLESADLLTGANFWINDLEEILNQKDFDVEDFIQLGQSTSTAAAVVTKNKKERKRRIKQEVKPFRRGRRGPDLQVSITRTDDGTTLYCCPECGVSFTEKSCLERHLPVHKIDRRFICEVCGVAMKRKEHIERHKLGHNDERPFVCNVCFKSFKRKEHHDIHYVIHSGEKTIICQECGKGFYRRDHLTTHLKSHVRRKLRKQRREEKLREKRARMKHRQNKSATKSNSCDFIIHILTGSEAVADATAPSSDTVQFLTLNMDSNQSASSSPCSPLPPFTELKRSFKLEQEDIVPPSAY